MVWFTYTDDSVSFQILVSDLGFIAWFHVWVFKYTWHVVSFYKKKRKCRISTLGSDLGCRFKLVTVR